MYQEFIPRKERIKNQHSKKFIDAFKGKSLFDMIVNKKELNKLINHLSDSFQKDKKNTSSSSSKTRTQKYKKKLKISFLEILLIMFLIILLSIPILFSQT